MKHLMIVSSCATIMLVIICVGVKLAVNYWMMAALALVNRIYKLHTVKSIMLLRPGLYINFVGLVREIAK